MSIVPKLYLNNNPMTAEEGSLAFARNMRIDNDGCLVSDGGYADITLPDNQTTKIVGHVVGLNDKVYFFTHDNNVSHIYEYDEIANTSVEINSGWKYSGGTITGYVNTNISGEIILTVAEVLNGVDIPLKHINLSYCTASDNESLYTQTPEVPIANLTLYDTYIKTIPNGVYVFFIRYEIRKDIYTNWFLCSRPIFGGVSEKLNTAQGGLKYINLHKDSAKSFILDLTYINESAKAYYSGFQIGFIITHDEATDARIWKSFNMTTTRLYFDYEEIEETNIDELLETTYRILNVNNVTSFKNKLYISNYNESDFNPDVTDILSKITLGIDTLNDPLASYKSIVFQNLALEYNSLVGYYDALRDGVNTHYPIFNSIYVNSLITSNTFDFYFTDLAKEDTIEVDRCAKFDVHWKDSNQSYLTTVFRIKNNLLQSALFGTDSDEEYGNGEIGLEIQDFVGSAPNITYILVPDTDTYHPTSKHSWYDEGLTFSYAPINSGDSTSLSYGRDGVYFCNRNSAIVQVSGSSAIGYISRHADLTPLRKATIHDNIVSEIKGKSFMQMAYIEITSGGKVYKIGYNSTMEDKYYAGSSYYTNHVAPDGMRYGVDITINDMTNSLKYKIISTLRSYIVGIDDNGVIVLNIDNDIIHCSSMAFKFFKYEFSVENEDIMDDEHAWYRRYYINLKKTKYTAIGTFTVKNNIIQITIDNDEYAQQGTLMPNSTYQPYIHLVDKYGVVTNGFKLANTISITGDSYADSLALRLKYSIDSTISQLNLKDYKAFFVSLENIGDIAIQLFDIQKVEDNYIASSLELDTMLYSANDEITIIDGDGVAITTAAKYYPSGTNNPIEAFGNCGYVAWVPEANDDTDYTNYNLFIKVTRSRSGKQKQLKKATPYIPLTAATNVAVTDGSYDGHVCLVKKPSYGLSSSIYVSGNEIFSTTRTNTLTLQDFKSYIQLQTSMTFVIKSTYNLNYLSLTEDLNDIYYSIGMASSGVKQLIKAVNSLTLSNIYELKSMYRDYHNKLFSEATVYNKTRFDNTIRVSNVLLDESFNNSVFKFEATNYYNIPTDRGILISLFSIGNVIYAHCESSLFKFNGNQTIMATDRDIKLAEADPFNNGVEQVIDSQYGYGGIKDKHNSCITYDAYYFYDWRAKHIFKYEGNGQLTAIDGPIKEFIQSDVYDGCVMVDDNKNNRLIIYMYNTANATSKKICLTYNYKSKSFISIIDFKCIEYKIFSTRNNTYTYAAGLRKIFTNAITIPTNTSTTAGDTIRSIYGNNVTQPSKIFNTYTDILDDLMNVSILFFAKQSEIEIIDSVRITAKFKDNILDSNKQVNYSRRTDDIPISKVIITTDMCTSTEVNTEVNDAARPNTLLDYKGFKYDKGSWVCNYFRNSLNSNNIYSYPNQPRVGQTPNSDNNSLVYGRYFIVNIAFKRNKAVKLEDVTITTNPYR